MHAGLINNKKNTLKHFIRILKTTKVDVSQAIEWRLIKKTLDDFGKKLCKMWCDPALHET